MANSSSQSIQEAVASLKEPVTESGPLSKQSMALTDLADKATSAAQEDEGTDKDLHKTAIKAHSEAHAHHKKFGDSFLAHHHAGMAAYHKHMLKAM